jgi:hypothetical protein
MFTTESKLTVRIVIQNRARARALPRGYRGITRRLQIHGELLIRFNFKVTKTRIVNVPEVAPGLNEY